MYTIYITAEKQILDFKKGKKYTKEQAEWTANWIKNNLKTYCGSKIKAITIEGEYESYGVVTDLGVKKKIEVK